MSSIATKFPIGVFTIVSAMVLNTSLSPSSVRQRSSSQDPPCTSNYLTLSPKSPIAGPLISPSIIPTTYQQPRTILLARFQKLVLMSPSPHQKVTVLPPTVLPLLSRPLPLQSTCARSRIINFSNKVWQTNIPIMLRIIGSLLHDNKVLISLAISPYVQWGSMFHAFLFGPNTAKHPLSFRNHTSNATKMYHCGSALPTPLGIIPLERQHIGMPPHPTLPTLRLHRKNLCSRNLGLLFPMRLKSTYKMPNMAPSTTPHPNSQSVLHQDFTSH
ncbi:LOW QUALITY PROTEIN: hypothetical protein ACHAXN_002230, partial [Cyclotella atomus]